METPLFKNNRINFNVLIRNVKILEHLVLQQLPFPKFKSTRRQTKYKMSSYLVISPPPKVNTTDSEFVNNEFVMNVVIPILSIIAFIVVLTILYYIDDPGLKEKEKLRQKVVELDYKALAKSMPEDGGPDPRWPLLSPSNLNVTGDDVDDTNNIHIHRQSLTVHNHLNDKNAPSRRRTYSDSTMSVSRVKKCACETQVFLENILIRGRKNSASDSRKASVRSLKEVCKIKLRNIGSSGKVDGKQTSLKRLESLDLPGPIKEVAEIPDYTDKNYVTIA